MKLVTSRRSTEPMIYRARRMPRLEIRPSGKTPGCFSSARKGGGVEQNRTRTQTIPENFRLEDPPQFFGQIFWEKILEIKIAGQRSWHRWSLSASRPTPQHLLPRPPASLRIYSARRLARR